MPVRVPARTAMREPDRLQFDIGDADSDVQPGLALHADGLQRVGILRPADQKVAAAADPDRCVGADATAIAREIAASNPAGRCIHRPGKPGLIGEADIQATRLVQNKALRKPAVKISDVRRRNDLTTSDCHKIAGCVCRRPRDRRSWPRRKSETPDPIRMPNPAPRRRLRSPAVR